MDIEVKVTAQTTLLVKMSWKRMSAKDLSDSSWAVDSPFSFNSTWPEYSAMFGSPSLSGRSELISSIKVAIMAEITEAVIKTIVKEPENKRVANWMQATQAKAPAL